MVARGGAFLQQLIDIKRRLVEQHPDNELLRDYDPTRAMPGRELFALFSLVQLQKDGLAEATPPRDTSGSLVWFPTRALAREMRLPHREPDKALPHHDPESQKATGMKEWPTLIAPRSRSACSRRNVIAMSPPSDSKAPCEEPECEFPWDVQCAGSCGGHFCLPHTLARDTCGRGPYCSVCVVQLRHGCAPVRPPPWPMPPPAPTPAPPEHREKNDEMDIEKDKEKKDEKSNIDNDEDYTETDSIVKKDKFGELTSASTEADSDSQDERKNIHRDEIPSGDEQISQPEKSQPHCEPVRNPTTPRSRKQECHWDAGMAHVHSPTLEERVQPQERDPHEPAQCASTVPHVQLVSG